MTKTLPYLASFSPLNTNKPSASFKRLILYIFLFLSLLQSVCQVIVSPETLLFCLMRFSFSIVFYSTSFMFHSISITFYSTSGVF